MSLTVTIDGEDVTDKVVINPLPSHKVTGSFKASGAWLMAHPKWKFGDVIQADDDTRAMVVNQTEFVIWVVVLTNPAPAVGRFGSLTERDIVRDDWHLVPEPDD